MTGERGRADLPRELMAGPSADAPAPATPSASLAGTTVGHFEVLDLLGAGGFGEVYRARDTRLGRMVAIKVLPAAFARDPERRERFRREALAASALNHPNICTVHELVEEEGRTFIVMELVEGKTLYAALRDGPLPLTRSLPIALQVTEALAEAHRAGLLHRDIKPGNIVLTARGQVKVLDFGLAKLVGSAADAESATLENLTAEGTTSGTLGYMSPEQLLGKQIDRRTDLFSFGVVLYEMVTGRLPFQGSGAFAVADAILHAEPRDFGDGPLPAKLKALIGKLLEKDPAKRFASAEELHAELKALEASQAPVLNAGISRNVRFCIAAALVVTAAVGGWLWHRASRARWARETATPEVARLVAAEEFTKAVALAREARVLLPNDPTLESLFTQATVEATIESDPPGADVSVRPYRGDARAWESLGQTPISKARVPRNYYVWKVSKPGFTAAYEIAPTWTIVHRFAVKLAFQLAPEGTSPDGMIRVPGGKIGLAIPGLDQLPEVPLDGYLIDRHEVTNEEFKRFVDAGGYQKRDFWKQPLTRDRRSVPWGEAIALFRDATGRPGPATWELGTFPKGMEKHPVAGVSWFEAAAYAEFAGRTLPTIYHWNRAAHRRRQQRRPWLAGHQRRRD